MCIALAGIYLLWIGWGKWPDVLVDFGRELYLPWQLSEGKVLYVDVEHFLGPLSPYLNAAWFSLFGVSLRTLMICNIVIVIVQIIVLHKLLSVLGNRLAVNTACVVFLFVFVSAQLENIGNSNYLCPYSHEAVHGSLLAAAAVLLFVRRLCGGGWPCLVASGALLGLAWLTRPVPWFAGAAAILVGATATAWMRRAPIKHAIPSASIWLSAAATGPLLAFALLCTQMPAATAWYGITAPWRNALNPQLTGMPFHQAGLGFDNIPDNLVEMLIGSLGYALLFGALAVVSVMVGRLRRGTAAMTATALVAAALIFEWTMANSTRIPLIDHAVRPLPLVMAVLIGMVLVRIVRARRTSRPNTILPAQLTILVYALATLGKMILHTRIYNYGFVLAMPAALVGVVVLLDWAPATIERRAGRRSVFIAAVMACLFVYVATIHRSTLRWQQVKHVTVGAGADAFVADAARGQSVNRMLAEMTRRIGPDQTLAVMPEGIMLNYLLRRNNPTPYWACLPSDFAMFGEQRIMSAHVAAPPDFILLAHRDTSEYGYRFFGGDYGVPLAQWIVDHYHPVARAGALPFKEERFGLLLLQRATEAEPETRAESERK